MANTYLHRTPSSTTNRRTWTWSAWIKRSSLTNASNGHTLWETEGANGGDNFIFQIKGSNDTVHLHTYGNDVFTTTRKLRDTNGWYHIVLAIDTTQATATNRIKLYINGELQTITQAPLFPSQNFEFGINKNHKHCIGSHGNNANYYFDGLMSHIHFADGTQYDASVFGETDATTGEWKIKTAPSFTLGTNGFTVLKDGNTVTDQSDNSNDFAISGTLTKTEDCPDNVFATLNSIDKNSTLTLTNGNNTSFAGSTGWSNATRGTLGIASGKFYWEMKITGSGTASGLFFGVCADTVTLITSQGIQDNATEKAKGVLVLCDDGQSQLDTNSRASMTSAPAFNDVLGCAVDRDNNTVKFYKNGSQVGSIDISSSPLASCLHIMPFIINYYTATKLNFNFGNGYFGTTAVSSAGTNASGNGIFEYDVPTGFTALSTKGLNL